MKLNPILCGPILRRIDTSKVCIWLTTSIQPDFIEVIVYELEKDKDNSWLASLITTDTTYNIHQLGSNLFVVLLEVTRFEGEPYKPKTLYGYDLNFTFAHKDLDYVNSYKGWKDSDYLLSNLFDTFLLYADLPYPVFIIPDTSKQETRIFYGSCRKTHGRGSDALNCADTLLQDHFNKYTKNSKGSRIPDFSIFHLGDQIYADDLTEEVFNTVQELSLAIMGYEEIIPEYINIAELSQKDLTAFLYNYIDGKAGYFIEDLNLPSKLNYLTSISTENRLKNTFLFLQSYFPGVIRDRDFYTYEVYYQQRDQDIIRKISQSYSVVIDLNEVLPREYLRTSLSHHLIKVSSIKFKDRRLFLRKNSSISTDDSGHLISFGEFAALYLLNWGDFSFKRPGQINVGIQLDKPKEANLEGLLQGNKKVRRLMANVPSYMIFDDHEITDEWNLDAGWRNAVEKSVTGRRLISNGLAAYWAFQAWGNDSSRFSTGFIDSIIDHLKNPLINKGVDDQSKANIFEESLLKFNDWAFVTPTNPVAVFIDTRTMRGPMEDMNYYTELNENKKIKAPRLMSALAYDKIEKLIASSNYKSDSAIIFCAPSPILGAPLFLKGQLHMVDGSFNDDTLIAGFSPKEPGRYVNDYEFWHGNPWSKYDFFEFIDTKIRPSKTIILSGDVHYGFHMTAVLLSMTTGKYYEIEQLTSSALKNNTLDKLDKINLLAYLSLYDSSDDKYKKFEEVYPSINSYFANGSPFPRFMLRGHLLRYSEIIDEDTWLIFKNNIGLLNTIQRGKNFAAINMFLYADYYNAPNIKSIKVTGS